MYQKWLQAFHAVAQSGSFTGAARELGVGQPTISAHVKTLEDHFRVELFYRRGRTVRLTPIGQSLLTITHGLFGYEEEALALLKSARNLDVGSMNLGAIRPTDVMEILADFAASHPNLKLSVTLGATPAILERLLHFQCDIGIIGHAPDDPRYHSIYFNRHRILVVINETHPLARRRTLLLKDLEGQGMVQRATGSTTRAAFDAALTKGGVKIRMVLETESREAVLRAVSYGIGIGVISESEFTPQPGIRALVIRDTAMFTHAYVVCLAERKERPLIRNFLSLAAMKAHTQRPRAASEARRASAQAS
jgi:aminoethylphosphonate catabolism LysR family transcriptional regulator